MANFYINPYPDLEATFSAGKEVGRLFMSGEAGNDPRHTVGCIMTAMVGLSGVYPGQPGISATALSADQEQRLDQMMNELRQACLSYQSKSQQQQQTQPQAAQGGSGQPNPLTPPIGANPPPPQSGTRGAIPPGLPAGPPYTPEQIKQLQAAGAIQQPPPEMPTGVQPSGQQTSNAQQQMSNAQQQTSNAQAISPGDITQWIPLILQLLEMIRRRRAGQPTG